MTTSMLSNQELTLKGTIPVSYGTGDTFEIFETLPVAVTGASIVFKNVSQLERLQVDITVDGECTIVLRGLDQTDTKVEDAALKKEWTTGAKGYITMLASDIFDVEGDFSIGGDATIGGDMQVGGDANIEGDTTLNNLEVDGQSNPSPVVADETARDVLYPSPVTGDNVWVESLNAQQIYNEGTGQWESQAVGTPAPDATESVKGIARIATEAEVTAGTDDETIVTPAKMKATAVVDKEYYAGEDLSAGDYTFVEGEVEGIFTTSIDVIDEFGAGPIGTSTYGFSIVPEQDCYIYSINTRSESNATRCYISDDSALTTPLATATITSNEAIFATPILLLSGTTYNIFTDNSGGSYTAVIDYSVSYPKTDANISITNAKTTAGGESTAHGYTISSITSYLPSEGEILTEQNIGDVTANTRVSRPAFGSGNADGTINLALAVDGSPSVDLGVRIETDNAGSPSGTLADANATATVTAASLITSLADTEIAIGSNEDKDTGVTYDTSDSITYKTGYKVSFDKGSKINTVTKDSSCTATTCYLMDSDKNILDTQSFSTDTATFNYEVTATDYYIMVDSGGSAYTSESKNTVTFPIDSNIVDYDAGVISPEIQDNDSGATYSSSLASSWRGVRFLATENVYLISATGLSNLYTDFRLLDDSGTLLMAGTVSGYIGTLNTPYLLSSGTYYKLEFYKGTSMNTDASFTYSVSSDTLDYVQASRNGVADASTINTIEKITTRNTLTFTENTNGYNISSMNVLDSIALTEGEKYHIVTYQGTYGSETVNGTNYYKIGFGTNNTTTRGVKLYETSRGSVDTDKRIYTNSDLFLPNILSKTDATYSYKIDRLGTSKETALVGTKPTLIIDGIDQNQTGMTYGDTMYLADTPGAIQNSAGSNSAITGRAISATKSKLQNTFDR